MATELQPFLQQIKNTANVTLDIILAGMVSATATAQALATTANSTATSAYVQANGAFNQANTATTAAGNAQTTANQGVAAAGNAQATANYGVSLAGSAYNQANNGVNIAQAAYAQANSGVSQAQAAQATANQGVAPSNVTSGIYGTASAIPVISVDYRGRITSATTTALQSFTSSLKGVVPAYGNLGANTSVLAPEGWFTPYTQTASTGGYVQLVGDLILIYGVVSLTNNGTTYNFPTLPQGAGFPNACLSIAFSSAQSASTYYCPAPTKSQFTLYASASGTYRYIAIGY